VVLTPPEPAIYLSAPNGSCSADPRRTHYGDSFWPGAVSINSARGAPTKAGSADRRASAAPPRIPYGHSYIYGVLWDSEEF
jgi:hypothetical protein